MLKARLLLAMLAALAPATARADAREKSAARGNSVLDKDTGERVFTAAAQLRMGLVPGAGAAVVQPPLGFGFGLKLAFYPVKAGPMRFGFGFAGGHDRFASRRVLVGARPDDPGKTVESRRWSTLTHTDLALGLGFQIPAGPLLVELGAGGGLGISSYRRAVDLDVLNDDVTVAYSPLVRADIGLGVPIRNNQGIALGFDLQQYFSSKKVVTVPDAPRGAPPDSVVFDLVFNVTLAYQMWF
ncbi:MAG: hypothetical protein JNL82_41895 [Myxococcales bacterium]|nr:hypothetical protein [Myxococcales bacterium]